MKRKFIFCLFLLSRIALTSSLENLESILSRAKNLDDFLSHPSLQEKYFSALRAYQSRDHFKCESFEQILDQVKLLAQKVPEFKERLWAVDSAKEFQAVTLNARGDRQIYSFRPIGRGFHRLWFDPSSEGCLTSSCEKTDLYAPDRWTSILKGNHFYAIEKDHIFVDSTLLVASLKNAKESSAIQFVSWTGGPLLTKELSILSLQNRIEKKSSLLEFALTQLSYPKTKEKNLFVLRSTELPEGLTKKELGVYNATSKKEKNKKVSLADLSLPDAMATQLRETVPRFCLTSKIKKNTPASDLLSFVGIYDQNNLASVSSKYLLPPDPNSIDEMKEALADVSLGNSGRLGELNPQEKSQAVNTLTNIFLKDPKAANREKSLMALNLFANPNANKNIPADITPGAGRSPSVIPEIPEVENMLLKGLSDSSPQVREIAAQGLLSRGENSPEAINQLSPLLFSNSRGIASKPNADREALLLSTVAPFIDKNKGLTEKDFSRLIDKFSAANKDLKNDLSEQMANLVQKSKDPFSAILSMQREWQNNPATHPLLEQVNQDLKNKELNCNKSASCKDSQFSKIAYLLPLLFSETAIAESSHSGNSLSMPPKSNPIPYQCNPTMGKPTQPLASNNGVPYPSLKLNYLWVKEGKDNLWETADPTEKKASCEPMLTSLDGRELEGRICHPSILSAEMVAGVIPNTDGNHSYMYTSIPPYFTPICPPQEGQVFPLSLQKLGGDDSEDSCAPVPWPTKENATKLATPKVKKDDALSGAGKTALKSCKELEYYRPYDKCPLCKAKSPWLENKYPEGKLEAACEEADLRNEACVSFAHCMEKNASNEEKEDLCAANKKRCDDHTSKLKRIVES